MPTHALIFFRDRCEAELQYTFEEPIPPASARERYGERQSAKTGDRYIYEHACEPFFEL